MYSESYGQHAGKCYKYRDDGFGSLCLMDLTQTDYGRVEAPQIRGDTCYGNKNERTGGQGIGNYPEGGLKTASSFLHQSKHAVKQQTVCEHHEDQRQGAEGCLEVKSPRIKKHYVEGSHKDLNPYGSEEGRQP